MFNLIVSVVSIVLVATLAIATVYYMSDFTGESHEDAEASRSINEIEQVVGAINMYQAENGGRIPESKQVLVDDEYLRAIPDGVDFSTDQIQRQMTDVLACVKVNERYNDDTGIYMEDPDAGTEGEGDVPDEYEIAEEGEYADGFPRRGCFYTSGS